MSKALKDFIKTIQPEPVKVSAPDNKLADEAIKSMKAIAGNSDAAMLEIINRLAVRPLRFDLTRDKTGDLVSIIPIYERTK